MAENGLFDRVDAAWDATTQWVGDAAGAVGGWVADNWEYIALAGVVVAATVIGGPIGTAMVTGMLISGGLSAGIQYATTGQIAWDQVAMSAAIGGAAGGAGAWAGGATATSSTLTRYGAQMGVDAATNVAGGMITRQATGQNPFDMGAVATDTLTGVGTGGLGARLQGAGSIDDGLGQAPPAIGFAPGEGVSALPLHRLQHGTEHLRQAGLLPNWRGSTSPQLIRDTLSPILENPTATFDNVLGGTRVKGFIGEIDGQQIAVQVFKEGPDQGHLATSVIPTPNQLVKWGLGP
jgi:hypothetical protein